MSTHSQRLCLWAWQLHVDSTQTSVPQRSVQEARVQPHTARSPDIKLSRISAINALSHKFSRLRLIDGFDADNFDTETHDPRFTLLRGYDVYDYMFTGRPKLYFKPNAFSEFACPVQSTSVCNELRDAIDSVSAPSMQQSQRSVVLSSQAMAKNAGYLQSLADILNLPEQHSESPLSAQNYHDSVSPTDNTIPFYLHPSLSQAPASPSVLASSDPHAELPDPLRSRGARRVWRQLETALYGRKRSRFYGLSHPALLSERMPCFVLGEREQNGVKRRKSEGECTRMAGLTCSEGEMELKS